MSRIFPGITPNFLPLNEDKVTQDELNFPHNEWSQSIEYFEKTGWRQVPLSGADPQTGATCRFVRESAGLGQKLVLWHVDRIGAMPELPAREPDTVNQKLLDRKIMSVVPILLSDGTTYRLVVTGYYLYGLDRPADPVTKPLPMGCVPTDGILANTYTIGQNDFKPST